MDNQLCEEYHYDCIYDWDNSGAQPQNQSDCVECNGQPNWTNDCEESLLGDINDDVFIKSIFQKYRFDSVIHLAAESHVDRSIYDPLTFAKIN